VAIISEEEKNCFVDGPIIALLNIEANWGIFVTFCCNHPSGRSCLEMLSGKNTVFCGPVSSGTENDNDDVLPQKKDVCCSS
jgi:hypothetical protein